MSEMNGTKQSNKTLEARRKVPCLRLAGAALAIGGLSTSLAVIGAGAATSSDVSTSQNAKYGTILVSGKTVYTLKASKVPCRVQCLKFWPEVLLPKGVTTTTAGPGVNAANLGTVRGSGGSRQVTYGGKRLYCFFKDSAPGQVKGTTSPPVGQVVHRRDGEAGPSELRLGRHPDDERRNRGSLVLVQDSRTSRGHDVRQHRAGAVARSPRSGTSGLGQAGVRAISSQGLPPGSLGSRLGSRLGGDRLVEWLGWCGVRRFLDEPACRRDRSFDPCVIGSFSSWNGSGRRNCDRSSPAATAMTCSARSERDAGGCRW